MDFSVIDEPPQVVKWVVSIVGEHGLAQVTSITIRDDRFSDADVGLLLAFPDVREIDISGTAISDEGINKLASLKQLVVLDISETQVSDASLHKLSAFKELRELNIEGVDADDEAVAFLQQELLKCWIHR